MKVDSQRSSSENKEKAREIDNEGNPKLGYYNTNYIIVSLNYLKECS